MKPAVTRFELCAVLIVFAIGVVLRTAWPERMAVEHFDEGVYASNLYSPMTGGRYPDQHLYAPPLLPFLLEWATILGGPPGAMWVNVVAGSLTLLVVWGMVRDWWGPAASIAALTLLAFNEFHIAYSRAALTDVLLGLWLTAGVWTGTRAILRGGPVRIALAATFAALAWWTKYNGWLTLAITGAGTAGWLLSERLASRKRQRPESTPDRVTLTPDSSTTVASGGRQPPDDVRSRTLNDSSAGPSAGSRRPLADAAPGPIEGLPNGNTPPFQYLLRWAAIAALAFALWSPWLWQLRQYGGYAAVARNHAGYFGGASQWLGNARQQLAAIARYQFVETGIGVLCLVTLLLLLTRRSATSRAAGVMREPQLWICLAWIIGLSVAIPAYRPYPRLVLPWLIAVIATIAIPLRNSVFISDSEVLRANVAGGPVKRWFAILGAFFLAGQLASSLVFLHGPAWQDRTSLRTVADETLQRLTKEHLTEEWEGYRSAIYVLAEPGLYFHLAAAQPGSPVGHLTQAASDYGMTQPGSHAAPIPAYLLVGPHADSAEADRLVAAGRLEPVAELDYHPSDLVLLDELPAWDLPNRPPRPTQRVRLFHVKTE